MKTKVHYPRSHHRRCLLNNSRRHRIVAVAITSCCQQRRKLCGRLYHRHRRLLCHVLNFHRMIPRRSSHRPRSCHYRCILNNRRRRRCASHRHRHITVNMIVVRGVTV